MGLQNESREHPNGRKVRYGVVGAGWISQEDFMPRSERLSRPCREQIIRLPAVESEELISAAAPDEDR
jgi:hypothetical protein